MTFFANMDYSSGIIMLITGIVITLACLAVIRRFSFAKRLAENNGMTGTYVASIAAIYGVLLGFMVVAVWTRFDQAEAHAEEEAATLSSVARLAYSLSPNQGGEQVLDACKIYATFVQEHEWPRMQEGKEDEATHQALDTLWKSVLKLQVTAPKEDTVTSQAISQMTQLSLLRQQRLLASRSGFPPLLWFTLVGGAVITVGSSLLLYAESFRLHAVMASCLWLVIGLSLLAASELSSPFNGDVHVDSKVFTNALDVSGAYESGPPLRVGKAQAATDNVDNMGNVKKLAQAPLLLLVKHAATTQ